MNAAIYCFGQMLSMRQGNLYSTGCMSIPGNCWGRECALNDKTSRRSVNLAQQFPNFPCPNLVLNMSLVPAPAHLQPPARFLPLDLRRSILVVLVESALSLNVPLPACDMSNHYNISQSVHECHGSLPEERKMAPVLHLFDSVKHQSPPTLFFNPCRWSYL